MTSNFVLIDAFAKHYIGNEQETYRNPVGNVSSVSSNLDDKTMHELYLWSVFEPSINLRHQY